ncbi:MAG TPA: hypothetical protein VNB49_11530 [Candidatus Dormibacteraeota bacterium]|nr:hypothetical protein [Candidatus Dormibacteraeota bacterium]
MTNASEMMVQILKRDKESLARLKDEEYAYWQSRPPLERLLATQELSLAFHEQRAMKLKLGSDFCDLLSAFHACNVSH